jgi:iron(III) transport system permease protein
LEIISIKRSIHFKVAINLAETNNKVYWWNTWSWLTLLILLVVATPILTIVFKLFAPPGQSWQHLTQHLLKEYFINTFWLLTGVAFFTFLIGVSTAWLISNFDFPGRKYFEWLLILPLAIPGYIMAYLYVGILSIGSPIYNWIVHHTKIEASSKLVDIMNLPGAIFILSITLYPYVFLISRTSFIQQSRTFQEASSTLGQNRWGTFFKVALPLARPAIVGGIALACMEVLNDYGTVKYFGIHTFTTGIFRAWFSLGDTVSAIYLAALLLLFVLFILYLENWQRGNKRFVSEKGDKKPVERIKLSLFARLGFTMLFLLVFAISFGIPFFQLIYWVQLSYHKILNHDFLLLVYRSFSLALFTGLIIIFLGIILLYTLRLSPLGWMKHVVKIATLGYTIPGAVIAVGVMVPLLFLDKWAMNQYAFITKLILSGSVFGLIFAYVVRFLAVGYNPLDSGFHKIGKQVNEASRMLGVSSLSTLLRVDLPLLKHAIIGGVMLVFVDVLKELPLTLILRPFNYHTLATKTFDMATNEMITESSGYALVIIMTGIFPIIVLNRLIRKREF